VLLLAAAFLANASEDCHHNSSVAAFKPDFAALHAGVAGLHARLTALPLRNLTTVAVGDSLVLYQLNFLCLCLSHDRASLSSLSDDVLWGTLHAGYGYA